MGTALGKRLRPAANQRGIRARPSLRDWGSSRMATSSWAGHSSVEMLRDQQRAMAAAGTCLP
jgi:hypothetical protein